MGEENRILIIELGEIVNRQIGTIRGWERDKKLPKKLLPKRDDRNRRYWTPAQVEGIKKWMKTHDMRPGNALSDPESEARHIENLRGPKLMTKRTLRRAFTLAKAGKTQLEIADELYDSTDYKDKEAFLKALLGVFKKRGVQIPPYSEDEKERRKKFAQNGERREKAKAIVAKQLGVKHSRLPSKNKKQRQAA